VDQSLQEFFAEFEQAISAAETAAVGRLYAETFLFAGPNGVQAVKKSDFLALLPKMKARYSSPGLKQTHLENVSEGFINPQYSLATVRWRMTVQAAAGARHVHAVATYLLMLGNDGRRSIAFQIDHQDLAALIAIT
jgi:ketosteroid isomerase-like protein